jgi:uncharacterized protein YaiE (UPF0345 family)
VTVAANGSAALTAATTNKGTTLTAVTGSAPLTAATTNTGTTLTAANGSIGLNAGGLIDWATLNAGTTIDIRSTAGAVALGTATSGGSQTIRSATNTNFTTLTTDGILNGDVGDVTVTADAGLIQGVTVAANGSAALTAATTNKGTTLTAVTGSATLRAGGLIDWTTLNAGTQINVRSTAGAVTLDSATSGGSQAIHGTQDVNFATLTTTGITGDAGNVDVTSDNGLIQGVTVAANGSAMLTAATTNKGTTLTALTGSATLLAGGLIDWTNVTAGTSFTATSTGGAINLGTAASGGSQTLHALDDVIFTSLSTTGISGDQGNIAVTSDQGSIRGASVSANGDASFDGGVSIDLGTLHGGSVALSTPRDLTIGYLTVYRAMSLAADTINVIAEQLPSVPAVPLYVTITGYRGGVATSANVNIDPPQIIMDRLSVTDIVLIVDSPNLSIEDGYVPGRMVLSTPGGDILMDNRTPAPVGGFNLQLYQPGGAFKMQQAGNDNFTDTHVVYYDSTMSPHDIDGTARKGSSFVRDALQDMKNGEGFDFSLLSQGGVPVFTLGGPPVQAIGEGPAVNIDGLPGGRKKLRSSRDRKRPVGRTSTLKEVDGAGLRFAAAGKW